MFTISSIINSPSSIIYHEERTILYHISPVKLSPKISRMPLYNVPPQPQPQQQPRVYFTLIPSHDCDDINLQMFCWYSCSCSLHKVRCSVVRLKSDPRYTFCQHHMYRLRPYSISLSICPNVCCCIMHPNSICCCVPYDSYYAEGRLIM